MAGATAETSTTGAGDLLSRIREVVAAHRVFGDAYERDGTTVIPVLRIAGGGGGGGEMHDGAVQEAAVAEGAVVEGGAGAAAAPQTREGGGGFGLYSVPVGVFVLGPDGSVRWEPVVDTTRIALGGMTLAMVALWTVRAVVREIVRST